MDFLLLFLLPVLVALGALTPSAQVANPRTHRYLQTAAVVPTAFQLACGVMLVVAPSNGPVSVRVGMIAFTVLTLSYAVSAGLVLTGALMAVAWLMRPSSAGRQQA
jgi:hypothetical protein